MNQSILDLHDRVLAKALEKKTILITGSTGLIGSNIIFYLAELNDRQKARLTVVALYRSAQKRDRIFAGLFNRGDIIFVKYGENGEIPYDHAIDFCIHTAGINGGMKMHLRDPLGMFETGIGGTRRALDFAVSHSCKRFLYLSSYEVYGDDSPQELIDEGQYCRLDTFSLRNLYVAIKLACESLLCAYAAQYGLFVSSARLTSTFGRGVRYDDPRFFAEFARCIWEGRDIILKTDGKTVRSYLDVRDAVTAFCYILTCGESCNAYNVTNMENEISIRDMALKMIEVTKAPVGLAVKKECSESALGFRREGRTVMDASKLLALGWKPAYTLEETILSLMHSMKNAKHFDTNSEEDNVDCEIQERIYRGNV